MAYVAYEIRMTKETPTGTRHLVRCNRLGKYAICSSVGSTGSVMLGMECQGSYDYVMKKWKELVDMGHHCAKPYKHRDGTVSFYTRDSEGNQLEFIC